MQCRGNDDCNCIKMGIGNERAIISVERTIVARSQPLSFLSIPAAHGCEFSLRKVFNNVFGVTTAVLASADESDAQWLHRKERYLIHPDTVKSISPSQKFA